ncbi:MAG: ABC transporter ATP-binding protein [Candidatus Symbiothrix sp.]|jgi:iron complex transport system ATP-binding protein|nr:ABC transporter ATP-binding protein [Candidatus Symbiothrix sp.]
MNTTVRIRQLSIGYKEKRKDNIVAQNLNAEIHEGELTCLLGANGIGKSTLLRTLAGFQAPLSGEIWIGNKKLSICSNHERAKIIGVVLTDKLPTQNLTVNETVSMGRSPYTGFFGTPTDEDQQMVQTAMNQLHISRMAHRSILTLSDGERQKVMIAKALAQQTPIILLDEPTAFLDFPSKVEIMQVLRRLSREMQKIIFLSTHDVDLALQTADCIWLMDTQGLTTGSPETLTQNGCLEHFFQSPDVYFDQQTGFFHIRK